jgi:hypothetical protein
MQCLWRLAVAAIVGVSLRCARFLEIRGWSRWRRGQKSWLRGTTLGLRSMLRLAPRRPLDDNTPLLVLSLQAHTSFTSSFYTLKVSCSRPHQHRRLHILPF